MVPVGVAGVIDTVVLAAEGDVSVSGGDVVAVGETSTVDDNDVDEDDDRIAGIVPSLGNCSVSLADG